VKCFGSHQGKTTTITIGMIIAIAEMEEEEEEEEGRRVELLGETQVISISI
jgi:hypothetical protein